MAFVITNKPGGVGKKFVPSTKQISHNDNTFVISVALVDIITYFCLLKDQYIFLLIRTKAQLVNASVKRIRILISCVL